MRLFRTGPPWAWLVVLGVLVALALGTAGWVGASSDALRAAPERSGQDAPAVLNDDGTVGPVVALGDSLTFDGSTDGGPGYESWYAAALADEPRLVHAANAGIPGDVTPGMVDRFARDVAAHTPRVVVILGGTNDLVHGRTPEQIFTTLERLADLAREAGAVPVLATIPPLVDEVYADQVDALNAAIRTSGETTGTLVIDFFSVLADDDGHWRKGFTTDGVHPTAAAAQAMGQVAVRTFFRS